MTKICFHDRIYNSNLVKKVFCLRGAINACVSLTLLAICVTLLKEIVPSNQDCNGMCLDVYISGPPRVESEDFLNMIREKYLEQPPEVTTFLKKMNPEEGGIWKRIANWNLVQQKLLNLFQKEPPGFFVEVGAVDGHFMSQTINLEADLGWKGLLIEPDPRSFGLLRQMKRDAWLTPLCINPFPSAKTFWIRNLEKGLSKTLLQIHRSKTKSKTEILEGDEQLGKTVTFPCVPLSSILLSIGVKEVGLLAIGLGGEYDVMKISDVLNNDQIKIKFLLVSYPLSKIYDSAFPRIQGYILDVIRSEKLVKLYVTESMCSLVSEESCQKVEGHTDVKACHVYICFGYMEVLTLRPGYNG